MTIIVRDATNTPRTITAIQVRDGTNTARDISEIWVRDSNNIPRLVFSTGSTLSVSVDFPTVGGVAFGSGIVETNPTEATATGGVAPYTYAWTTLSHTNATPPTINFPTDAITDFTQTGVVSSDGAQFRVTATDDVGATATADVSAFFQNVV